MAQKSYYGPRRVLKAREFRRRQTSAEKILWDKLRNRKLGGYKFRLQHIINDFIVDFYCAEKRLIIELDGLYHKDQFQEVKDKNREQELADSGYSIMRFSNTDIEHGIYAAMDLILNKLAILPSSEINPLFTPLPRHEVERRRGEGGEADDVHPSPATRSGA
jgi:very-short-patch-repair endonuclease